MTERFNAALYQAALSYYGLPGEYGRTFTSVTIPERGTFLCACDPARASQGGGAVWVQLNRPGDQRALTRKGKARKARNDEIEIVLNVSLDFEYPEEPAKAHMLGRKLAAFLSHQKLARYGLPVEDSGGGCHIVLPLVPIHITKDSAPMWNLAVRQVVKERILPEFERLAAEAGLSMELEGFDISRVLSCPGTWRPHNPGKQDCEALRQGYLRRWLYPYHAGDVFPVRRESEELTLVIRRAYQRLLEPPKERFRFRRAGQPRSLPRLMGDGISPGQWLQAYAAKHSFPDRSSQFQSLVGATLRRYGEARVWQLKEEIHALCGEKYAGRLDTEITRSLTAARSGRDN